MVLSPYIFCFYTAISVFFLEKNIKNGVIANYFLFLYGDKSFFY